MALAYMALFNLFSSSAALALHKLTEGKQDRHNDPYEGPQEQKQ